MSAAHELKKVVNALLRPLGLEVRRVDEGPVPPRQVMRNVRHDMGAVLHHARATGFVPGTIIDVGAAHGTEPLYATFPKAHHVLVEPLREFEADLRGVMRGLPSAELHLAVASAEAGTMTLHVHPDRYGSSLYLENEEDSFVNGVPREVPAVTLDELYAEADWPAPFLLKADVQGAELDVLAGAEAVLAQTEYVVLETVFFQTFEGGPTIAEVVGYMHARGFVPYEVFGPLYRPLDGAMSQVDVAFVRADGRFREEHAFATPEQRARLNA
jgi:FkbM family methyltransferase